MIDFLMLDLQHLLVTLGLYQDPEQVSAWPALKGRVLAEAGRRPGWAWTVGLLTLAGLYGVKLIVEADRLEFQILGLFTLLLSAYLVFRAMQPLRVRSEGLDLYGVFFPWKAIRSVRWTPRGQVVVGTGNGFTCTLSLPESVREEFRGAVDRARAEHASRDSVAQADMRALG